MTVKDFKEYLNLYSNNDLIIKIFQDYLKRFGTNTECEVILQSAFDRLKELSWEDKNKRMNLEQQLKMTKMYLKGEIYTDEKTAREMLYKQIANIEEILDDNK